MITALPQDRWRAKYRGRKKDSILVDLSECQSREAVIAAIGRKLKAQDSQLIRGESLDALTDVVGDWFIENWGKRRQVFIANGDRLFDFGRGFAEQVLACIDDAFLAASHDRAINHDGAGVAEEIGLVRCYLEVAQPSRIHPS